MMRISNMMCEDSRSGPNSMTWFGRNGAIGLCVALLWVLLCAVPAMAQDFPSLSGRVVDQAGLLNPAQVQDITTKSEALEKASGRQFVVAAVNDLGGQDIESYGNQLGRHWGIGSKDAKDGVILLIAPNERKVRIEVGYGLEPILTDALSSLIIQRQILPRFKKGDMPGGIMAGADAIIQQISLPAAEAQARQQQMLSAAKKDKRKELSTPIVFFVIFAAILLFMFLARKRHGTKYRGGPGPVIIWGSPFDRDDDDWGGGGGWGGGSGGSSWGGGSGFSGGGGSFGGGGASGGW